MRCYAYTVFLMIMVFALLGCETAKGAGKGLVQDTKNTWDYVHNESGWIKKSDNWIRENMW